MWEGLGWVGICGENQYSQVQHIFLFTFCGDWQISEVDTAGFCRATRIKEIFGVSVIQMVVSY